MLLYQGPTPSHLMVDGETYDCELLERLDADLVTKALEKQLDAARVRRVAGGTESVRGAVKQLSSWISSLEAAMEPMRVSKLELAKAFRIRHRIL